MLHILLFENGVLLTLNISTVYIPLVYVYAHVSPAENPQLHICQCAIHLRASLAWSTPPPSRLPDLQSVFIALRAGGLRVHEDPGSHLGSAAH